MAGGLFVIDAEWFKTLGYYDPELAYYGGENLELSFKVNTRLLLNMEHSYLNNTFEFVH